MNFTRFQWIENFENDYVIQNKNRNAFNAQNDELDKSENSFSKKRRFLGSLVEFSNLKHYRLREKRTQKRIGWSESFFYKSIKKILKGNDKDHSFKRFLFRRDFRKRFDNLECRF